ncbi:MAG: suppressor of fused domain protein [Deltaproteobacteria bacterium]|nr:suppressor of fused domain protein [Deltaproteobacteria bacterium]MDQ3295471.1 tetratricopeptide repeat protein [Myxococcota bacterium]
MTQAAADSLVAEAHELFRAEKFPDAAARFEKATQLFPPHALAWKGLGHALLCMGKPHEAARAFDHAIGLAPHSATALWGGAVAHADVGNKVVAQSYLRRTLALQPSWVEMARGVPSLAQYLAVSTRAADALRNVFPTFSTRSYRHSADQARAIDVARIINQPQFSQFTYISIGFSNHQWADAARPRLELIMSTVIDTDICGQILANLAFHLSDNNFFPEPGVMVRDVIGALGVTDLSQRLPHVYITVPRLWKLELPLDESPPAITLAQVVPVSEAEYVRWRANVVGFEGSLAERKADISDLRRPG